MIAIADYPPPLYWSILVSAKANVSTLQCRFDEDLGTNPTPLVSYSGDPFPYLDGRFHLGVVDTDRIRSSDHPQGPLEIHDANLYAGTRRGADSFNDFIVNLGDAVESASQRSPTYAAWQEELTRYGSGVSLAEKIAAALADLTDWDRAQRRLFEDFQTMVPEGDWSKLVCVADSPTAPTLIPRVVSHRWRKDYASARGEFLFVRYLLRGEEKFVARGLFDAPKRWVGGIQYDLGSANLELSLQELKGTASNREATAEVPLPETAMALAALMPGRGVVIDGTTYWITEIRLASQSDVLAMDLRQPSP